MSKIEETLEIVEELYEYSILNKNDFVKEKSRQLMRNLDLISELGNSLDAYHEDYSDEIAKVKRKVQKWMKKPSQYNYRILKNFMDLSGCNEHKVSVDELEECVDVGQVFLANYNSLKTISEKNHAKVFDETDKMVELWEPVAEFIKTTFTKENKKVGQYAKEKFTSLLENNLLSNDILIKLQDESYVKDKFDMNFPILKKITEESIITEERKINGYDRYYTSPIKNYLLCNDWYDRNRNKLDFWLNIID